LEYLYLDPTSCLITNGNFPAKELTDAGDILVQVHCRPMAVYVLKCRLSAPARPSRSVEDVSFYGDATHIKVTPRNPKAVVRVRITPEALKTTGAVAQLRIGLLRTNPGEGSVLLNDAKSFNLATHDPAASNAIIMETPIELGALNENNLLEFTVRSGEKGYRVMFAGIRVLPKRPPMPQRLQHVLEFGQRGN